MGLAGMPEVRAGEFIAPDLANTSDASLFAAFDKLPLDSTGKDMIDLLVQVSSISSEPLAEQYTRRVFASLPTGVGHSAVSDPITCGMAHAIVDEYQAGNLKFVLEIGGGDSVNSIILRHVVKKECDKRGIDPDGIDFLSTDLNSQSYASLYRTLNGA